MNQTSWKCPSCGFQPASPSEATPEKCPRCGTSKVNFKLPPFSFERENEPPSDFPFTLNSLEPSLPKVTSQPPSLKNMPSSSVEIPHSTSKGFEKTLQETTPSKETSVPIPPQEPPSLFQEEFSSSEKSNSVPSFSQTLNKSFLETFGPTFAICLLFIGWAFYDRSTRPPLVVTPRPSENLMLKAIQTYNMGEKNTALGWLSLALQKEPHSQTLLQLQKLFIQNKPPKPKTVENSSPDEP